MSLNSILQLKSRKKSQVKSFDQAIVTTPIKLSSDQISELTSTLTHIFNLPISVTNLVDANVISGIKVQVGDYVIDQTIKHQLEEISQSL